MSRERRDDPRYEHPREHHDEGERFSGPRGGDREDTYEAFGGLDLRERMQGPRERGGWRGGPYQTGGFQGGGGYSGEGDRGFDFGGGSGGGGYRGAAGYRGGQGPGREEPYRSAAPYHGERDRFGAGETGDRYRGYERDPQGAGGPRPSSRVAADYRHFAGQGDPGWGDTWGAEEQTGWRGPGEMPGYRAAVEAQPHFAQSSSGGQIPGEFRNWSRGPHAGRGPRGYRRSDERIHAELCDRLTADPEIDASDLEVEVKEGRVVLSGAVSDRWMKHRAEDVADAVLGVSEVENRVRVLRRGDAGSDPRPAATAPTGARGHGNVLHAEAPELLGAPQTTGDADAERGSGGSRSRKARAGSRRGGRAADRDDAAKH